jgi:hypothetical protein
MAFTTFLHHQGVKAQPLANPLTCLGDGHDGIWNIIAQLTLPDERREILGSDPQVVVAQNYFPVSIL